MRPPVGRELDRLRRREDSRAAPGRSPISVARFSTSQRPVARSSRTIWAGSRGDAGAERPDPLLGADRADVGEGQVDRRQGAGSEVDQGQLAQPALDIAAQQPPGAGEGIGRQAEHPLRLAELRRQRQHRLGRAALPVAAIQVPPAGAVGDEDQPAPVRRPFRLEHRFARPAGQHAAASRPARRRRRARRRTAWSRPRACCGWSQASQASRLPSGDSRGEAKKSWPWARMRTLPAPSPSSGTATIMLSGWARPGRCRSPTPIHSRRRESTSPSAKRHSSRPRRWRR